MQPQIVLAVAVGGALGTTARFGIARWMGQQAGTFPWATWIVNISGSFVLGLLLTLVLERFPPTRYVRPFAATGFLGAYTTYSTFAVETDLLVKAGHPRAAVVYVVASVLGGCVAVWGGILLASVTRISGKGARR
ncbi:MAG: fluoride efflux transporter CrcB [Mycobacteriales bacterium]|nr:fluoride efflux transporter CrcB [Frankia sp.]